jgi:hypothetical protein
VDDAQLRQVVPSLTEPRGRAAILQQLAAHPDWSIVGTIGAATGFAVLVTYRPTRSHGSIWYRAVGADLFALADVRCADD